jgi:hypothetical protein
MNKTSVNSFIKGMSKDVDKSVMSKDSYLDANNFRIVTSEGGSSGALENVKGNKLITNYPFPAGQLVCGSELLRDDIIVFTTSNTSATPTHGAGRSMIHKFTINNTTEQIASYTLLYDDAHNAGTGSDTLDLSTAHIVKAVTRYETPNIQKVYFTDAYNNLRYIDIGKNLTITGGAYTVNNYMATAMFEFLPTFIPSKPILLDMVGGNLMGGMVQYSYQLYKLNGAETAYSPVSDMIHLVNDNDFSTNTLSYKGDEESINTGKGCSLSINNLNTGYDRLRLVRIHHTTLNSVPVLSVVNEIEISSSPGTINIVDDGGTISSLTMDEFSISSTELFKCEDIATKDNRLFAANITKSEFEVDEWDSRAVRFRSASTATIVDGSLTPVTILANLTNWSSYLPNHDGINQFNDPDNDGDAAYEYKYCADGSTLGAEGLNVQIDFETEPMLLDTSQNDVTFHTTPPTNATDLSYENYASPWKDGKLSWQRDETYRLSVVFGNDRGQVAAPKWICDLRMPSLHDPAFTNTSAVESYPSFLSADNGSSIIYTHVLYPRIRFKSFPTNATWAQIYRVKRERKDRSIITQGFAIPSQKINTPYCPTQADQALPVNGEIIKLVSPEINITKNVVKQSSDYIEYVTNYDIGYTMTRVDHSGAFGDFGHVYKMYTNTRVPYTPETRADIDDASPMAPSTEPNVGQITIDGKQYTNYDYHSSILAKGSTGLVIAYTRRGTWDAEGIKNAIVNYKSNVFGSQYGGNTYEDKMLNLYIPCSDIIRISNIGTWIDIRYGDTFINYFDVSTLLVDLSAEHYYDTWTESVYVPLESSINCDLRHDIEAAHFYPIPGNYDMYNPYFRQETAGTYTMTVHVDDHTFVQTKDLYLYNTVYSQQTSAQYAMSEMLDTPTETEFDCLVKASNMKYNGELSDSWTSFNLNEEIEVDSTYGEIKAVSVFNDKLLFWQTDGFGVLSVNTRSLIQDGSSAQLALGTGGVLDRYDYISTSIGILNKFAMVISDSAVYWFYDKEQSIYRFASQLSNLTKEKGMWSWFKVNYSPDHLVHGVYDRTYNEVLFTLYDDYTIAFNEQTDQFTSFYDFVPRIYIDYKDGYLSIRDVSGHSHLYVQNSNIRPRCEFYGTIYTSDIKILYNDDYTMSKTYDNVFYNSNAYDEATDVDQYGITFDKVRCYNDYQNSDWVTLTYPTNIMRRERGWTLDIPRNLVETLYTSGDDIFIPENIGTLATKPWAERIRDKYMVLDLSFDNSTDTRFVVPFVGIKYRISMR